MCSQSISSARTRKHGDHPHICVLRWLGVPRIFLSAPLSSDAVAFYLSRGAQHLRDGKLATSYKLTGTIQGCDSFFEQQSLQLLFGGRLLGLEVLRERIRNRHQDFHSRHPPSLPKRA